MQYRTPRPDRHQGQPLRARRDDVRRVDRQPRPRRLDPHHPQGARRGHQLRRHRRRLRRLRGGRRQGAQGTPRRRRPRDQGQPPDGRRPQPAGRLAALDHDRGRELAAPPADRPHRPLPDPPARPRHRHRGDALRALRPRCAAARSARSGRRPCPRRRSSRRSGSPSGAVWSGSAPSSRRTRSSTAASSARCCRSRSATAWARWSGARSGRACSPAASARAGRPTLRRAGFLKHLSDERRLDAVEQLIPLAEEAGLPMTHLAMAFAIAHPGVTSAIIGPRTMEPPRRPARRRRRRAHRRHPRPDRRDRPARHRRRHARPGVRAAGAPARRPAPPPLEERAAASTGVASKVRSHARRSPGGREPARG